MAERYSHLSPEESSQEVNSCWTASESVSGLPLLLDDKEVEEALRDALSYEEHVTSCTCERGSFAVSPCGTDCIYALDADSLMAVADNLMQPRGISEAPIITIIRAAVTDPNVLNALVANTDVRQVLSKIRRAEEGRAQTAGDSLEDKASSSSKYGASNVSSGESKETGTQTQASVPHAFGSCEDSRLSGHAEVSTTPGGHSMLGRLVAGFRDMAGDAAALVGCALRGYKGGGGGTVRDHLGRVGLSGSDPSDFDNWCVRVERQSLVDYDGEDDGSGGELVGFALLVAVLVVVFMLLRRADTK